MPHSVCHNPIYRVYPSCHVCGRHCSEKVFIVLHYDVCHSSFLVLPFLLCIEHTIYMVFLPLLTRSLMEEFGILITGGQSYRLGLLSPKDFLLMVDFINLSFRLINLLQVDLIIRG